MYNYASVHTSVLKCYSSCKISFSGGGGLYIVATIHVNKVKFPGHHTPMNIIALPKDGGQQCVVVKKVMHTPV